MRLEKKHDAELAKRQGQARRTVIQIIWLAISFAVAYFIITTFVFDELITHRDVYRALQISSSQVPEWAITVAFMLIIVFVMQFIFFIGFFFTSYEGRRRPGDPTLYSRNKDPLDNQWN